MMRLVKLAYLSEVRFAAEHGSRLTEADYFSWNYGPYSKQIANRAKALPDSIVEKTVGSASEGVSRTFVPKPGCEPSLEPGIKSFIDSVLVSYGSLETNVIVRAAYRTAQFQRTKKGRDIDLDEWSRTASRVPSSTAVSAAITEGLRTQSASFNNIDEFTEYLAGAAR